jgi:hypothetical protein
MVKSRLLECNCLFAKIEPILKELEDYGVIFKEIAMPYLGYNPDKEFS